MKKLALALILAVILTLTLGVPVFAAGPDNMPADTADHLLEDVQWKITEGVVNGLVNSQGATQLYGLYATSHTFNHLHNGTPPAKPHWAGQP